MISDTLHDAVNDLDGYLVADGPYSPDDNLDEAESELRYGGGEESERDAD